MNGVFYTGVVENRLDPLQLGRCQVRVVGLHSENKNELPMELLPWAYPMQPVTSAAMNGIGHTPLGPVEGTWVVIFFRDQECQQPVMMGTIGGVPQDKGIDSNYVNDGDDYLIKTDGGGAEDATNQPTNQGGSASTDPAPTEPVAGRDEAIGPLTDLDVGKYKDNVGLLETTSTPGGERDFTIKGNVGQQNYGVVNPQGRIGKYQMDAKSLNLLGYVKRVLNSNGETVPPSNFKLADDTVWTGKGGATSVTVFLSTADLQEQVMEEWTAYNYAELTRLGIISSTSDKKEIAGYLQASHPDGTSRAQALKSGQDIDDGYGNTTTDLYKSGYSSLEGDQPKTLPQNVPAGVDAQTVPLGETRPDGTISDGTNNSGVSYGFGDPNKKYPLKEFLNEPDTNRLARHEQIDNTIVGKKDATRTTKVPVSITQATWDQPESPFNASYPFNHVYQSESGHVQEFDDTPENERIHQYHKSGSFTEWDANGTQVNKIVGDNYQIVDRNGYLYVKGVQDITIDGVANIFVRSAANIEIIGDTKAYFRNNVDMRVAGKMDLSIAEDFNIECQNLSIKTRENMTVNTADSFYLKTTNDTHLFSGVSTYVTALGNINVDAVSNLLLKSGFSTNIKSESYLNLYSGYDFNLRTPADINIQTKYFGVASQGMLMRSIGRFDIKSRTNNINIDAGAGGAIYLNGNNVGVSPSFNVVYPNEAEAAIQKTAVDLEYAGDRITPVNPFFAHLSLPPRNVSGSQMFEAPEDGDPSKYIDKQRQSGRMPPTDQAPTTNDTATPSKPPPSGVAVPCEGFKNMTEFPVTTKLSANFYLGDFIPGGGTGYICSAKSPHKLQDQDGLTKAQIVCNLKALAENVLENIIKIVPKSDITITSGYRQKGLVGAESATSQHPKGMACDIVLKKSARDRKKHYDLIQEIAAKVPHDQLILEYQDSNIVWIHVSYNGMGTQRNMNFTMNNHHTHTKGAFTLLA
jgi:hypothetical protein